jgi:lipoprotein-anchoring transpeptidase ErfK/SrfK
MLKFLLAACAAIVGLTPVNAAPKKLPQGSFEILGAMSTDEDYGTPYKKRANRRDNQDWSLSQLPKSDRFDKHIVEFKRNMPAGSILVQTKLRKLFFVLGNGKAIEYPVGVGREGFQWSGKNRISRKAEWPTWRPPPVMIKREAAKGHDLPEEMEGGPENPLGARAMYIGNTEFRIHGTTTPSSIGKAVSSGCIRLLNEHVIDLYERVKIGASVIVEQ